MYDRCPQAVPDEAQPSRSVGVLPGAAGSLVDLLIALALVGTLEFVGETCGPRELPW